MQWQSKRRKPISRWEWHTWFAWFPVTLLNGRTVWLEQVYRRAYGISSDTHSYQYDRSPFGVQLLDAAILGKSAAEHHVSEVCKQRDAAIQRGDSNARELGKARAEITRLRAAVRNQCGDNLCWLNDTELGKIPPREQFLESCSRYHSQIAGTAGVLRPGHMTIAQLEGEIEHLRAWIRTGKAGVP